MQQLCNHPIAKSATRIGNIGALWRGIEGIEWMGAASPFDKSLYRPSGGTLCSKLFNR
jgi:hypothetical protein